MKKQTIAVDIDDVLAASVESWIAYSNEHWGTHLTIEDYDEDWAKMWGVDHEEGRRRSLEIYNSGVVSTFKQNQQAKPVLETLGKHYKLVITTSRVEHVHDDTLAWLDQHFNNVFDEIHLAHLYDTGRVEPTKLTKAELLQSIGADYLIDDQPKHCFAAAEAGIESVLFGEYPWSRDFKKLPKGVTRCKDWAAVLEYFNARG